MSGDRRHLLLWSSGPEGEHSYYTVLSLDSGASWPVSAGASTPRPSLVLWAPEGATLALSAGGRVYTAKAPDWGASLAAVGGGEGQEGRGDLTYRSRVWGERGGLWWAPGGSRLAFSTFHCAGGDCGAIVQVGQGKGEYQGRAG